MKSVDEATRAIRAAVKPLGAERVKLAAARGRIIAAPVFAGRALPPWDNSAMDGFAVRANEVPGTLPIAATIAAGTSPTAGLAPGTCARIMTGAPVPDGADAVIMREDAEVVDGGGRVAFAQPVNPGQHIRRAGGDIAPGDRALCAGTEMDAPAIGLLAALGHDRVDVARKPAVAIISTGDELIEVGQDLGPGQIYSSNNHALAAQIDEAGGIPIDLGIAPDNLEAISASFERARSADIIVTSGGVSVGDFDFVRDALAAIGAQVAFWKVAIKPGKPLVFGTAPPATLIFGLPGNPVSSMVTFELFVRPVIRAMLGATVTERPRAPVVLGEAYKKAAGRAHYVRARVHRRDGRLHADILTKQGSGMITSMIGANALLEIAADAVEVAAGDEVPALLLGSI